jgi:hypothetical protein
VAAVSALLEGLGRARASLGSAAAHDELLAGALWLRSGGESGELAALRERAPDRSLAVALVVSADLVARGWSRGEALDGVRRLLTAGLSDAGFLALRDEVDRAVKRGNSVAAAARGEVARLTAARPPP